METHPRLRQVACLLVAASVLAGTARSAPSPEQVQNAEIVLVGRLTRVTAGPVGMSFPPLYNHTLQLDVAEVLRGDLGASRTAVVHHSARQEKEPVFPVGKDCLVLARRPRPGQLMVLWVGEAKADEVAAVRASTALPAGWRVVNGKPVSPWAGLAWTGQGLEAEVRCSASGRPALMAGSSVEVAVAPVPPAKEIEWTNPDGDGLYTVTVTNTSDAAIEVPALIVQNGTIRWADSVAILGQGAHAAPGSRPVSGPVSAARLAPGQSVSGTVGIFGLRGIEWPQGGSRVEFTFAVGERTASASFYYMGRHHDAIRAAAEKKLAAP